MKGKTVARQTCKDGDAGCDADGTVNGSCTFIVAACFSREDAALREVSAPVGVGVDVARRRRRREPAASDLVAAVAALAPSSVSGTAVTFTPMLAEKNACSGDVSVVVACRSRLPVLKARTDALTGKPKDTDVLRLAFRTR